MKKLLSFTNLVIFLIALSSLSCKKEKTIEELLIGEWTCVSVRITTYVNSVKDQDNTYPDASGDSVFEFLSDGTLNIYYQDVLMGSDTWEIKGDYLIATPNDLNEIKYLISVDENSLTLTSSFENSMGKTVIHMVYNRV